MKQRAIRVETEQALERRTAILKALPGTVSAIAFSTGLTKRVVQKHLLVLEARGVACIGRKIMPKTGAGTATFYWQRGVGDRPPLRKINTTPRPRSEGHAPKRKAAAGATTLAAVMSIWA